MVVSSITYNSSKVVMSSRRKFGNEYKDARCSPSNKWVKRRMTHFFCVQVKMKRAMGLADAGYPRCLLQEVLQGLRSVVPAAAEWLKRRYRIVKKSAYPGLLYHLYFRSFQTDITIFTTIYVKNRTSMILCWDSNPQPLERESPPIITRLGLPFVLFIVRWFFQRTITVGGRIRITVQPVSSLKRLDLTKKENMWLIVFSEGVESKLAQLEFSCTMFSGFSIPIAIISVTRFDDFLPFWKVEMAKYWAKI